MLSLIPDLVVLSIPSPSESVWHLGPVPIRGYALSIILGIVAAIWIGEKRWVARGGRPGRVSRTWPCGRCRSASSVAGSTTSSPTTTCTSATAPAPDRGAVRLARRPRRLGRHRPRRRRRADRRQLRGIKLLPILDALAPGRTDRAGPRPLGQLVQPGAVRQAHRPALGARRSTRSTGRRATRTSPPSTRRSSTSSSGAWLAFAVIMWLDRRYQLGHGRVLALYVMGYTLGRVWIEMLRIDTVELDNVLGLRLNVWTSIVLFVARHGVLRLGRQGAAARRRSPCTSPPERSDAATPRTPIRLRS